MLYIACVHSTIITLVHCMCVQHSYYLYTLHVCTVQFLPLHIECVHSTIITLAHCMCAQYNCYPCTLHVCAVQLLPLHIACVHSLIITLAASPVSCYLGPHHNYTLVMNVSSLFLCYQCFFLSYFLI